MMLSHVVASLQLLIAVVVALATFIGWGSLFKRAIDAPFQNQLRFSDAWLGLFSVITVVETCHLWIAIDWKISICIMVIGLVSLIPHLQAVLNTFNWHSLQKKPNPLLVIAACFLMLAWTSLALTAPSIYDSGLYHFQAIRWINEYPIVTGLGNLSGRLAFNQSYFPYLALLNISPFFGKGYALGGLLLMTLSFATLIEAQLHKMRGGWWLNLWIMIALIQISRYLSSPSPDVAVVLIQVAIFIFLIEVYNPDLQAQEKTAYSAIMVFFLACLLVAVKLSGAIFASMAILILLPKLKTDYAQYKKVYYYSFLIGTYFISIHLFRGILLSGMPLYPSTLGALSNLDWSVTREQAIGEANWIYSWARDASKTPDEVLSSWTWLAAWTDHFLKERWQYVYGALVLFTLDLFTLLRPSINKAENKLFVLFLPFFAAVVFWFLTAPDWRFLGAIPQLLIGLSGWIVIRRYKECLPRSFSFYFEKLPSHAPSLFVATIVVILMTKTADFKTLPLIGWGTIPKVEVTKQQTMTGLELWTPITGDQCWNTPLPCAPKLIKDLHLRDNTAKTNNLKQGFSVKNN